VKSGPESTEDELLEDPPAEEPEGDEEDRDDGADSPEPASEAKEVVAAFLEDYGRIVLEAQKAAETTATGGWATIYEAHRRELLRERRRIASGLRELAEVSAFEGLSEEEEKELGDLRKAATALREKNQHFEETVVSLVRLPAVRASDCINLYRSKAESVERHFALNPDTVGTIVRMSEAIASVPIIRWDLERGILSVSPSP